MLPRPLWVLLPLLALTLPPARGAFQGQSLHAPPKPHPEVQALLEQGDKARSTYRWEEALRVYDQALEKARGLNDRVGLATTLNNIGEVHRTTGKPRKALEHFERALPLFQAVGDKWSEAATLSNLGLVYRSTGELRKALECYEKALPLWRAVDDKGAEATALTGIGTVYRSTGESRKALEYYQQALPLSRAVGDKGGEAVTLNNIGLVYRLTGAPREALEHYEQALALLRAVRDRAGEAETLNNIGVLYRSTGEPRKALEYYERALPLRREVGDKAGEAVTLTSIGVLHRSSGEPRRALEYYERALPLHREVGNKAAEATTLNNLGVVYASTGEPRQALEYYEKALSLRRAIADTGGEALTLITIGQVYQSTGEPRKALEQYERALPLVRTVGDRRSEMTTLNNIGAVYDSTGEPGKALGYFQQALSLSRAIGDKSAEATAFHNIGQIYRVTGEPRRALEYYEKALPLRRAVGDKAGEALTLNSIGSAHRSIGEPREALEHHERALGLQRAVGDKSGEATALAGIGVVYDLAGEPSKAIEHYDRALPLFRAAGRRGDEAAILQNQALVRYQAGDRSAAAELIEQSINLQEQVRGSLGASPDAMLGFLAQNGHVYRWRADLLLEEGRPDAAFHAAQRAKAGTVINLMAGGRVDFSGALTPEDRQRERDLEAEVSRLHMLFLRAPRPGGALADRATPLRQAETTLATFRSQLYARYPEVASRRAAISIQLSETGRFLPADTALLEYVTVTMEKGSHYVADRTLLFCVTLKDGAPSLQVYPVARTRAHLAEQGAKLQEQIQTRREIFRLAARELHGALIAPAARQLAGKKRLVICPDGPLWNVPFQALLNEKVHGGEDRFLVEEYEVVYAYSATHAKAALDESNRPERRKPAGDLFVLANPDFGDVAGTKPLEASRSLALRDAGLAPLAGTQAEAAALQRVFPRAAIHIGGKAQEATVKREAGKYRYLHFATHGIVHPGFPLLSNMALAQKPQEGEEDGFLMAREIFDLNLSAEMVVLSACETGRGDIKSEGIVGLLWSLFAAGSPTQVVSQWRVEDRSTAKLMEGFYRRLKASNGKGKGAALRAAARQLMRDGRHHHPFYWAPFILVGDWR